MTTEQATTDISAFAGPLLEKFLELKAVRAEEDATITEADVALLLDEVRETAIRPAMADILRTVPGAAAMPPEELSALVGEALTEIVMEALGA
ncbi:hypothetical protein [Actinophytocola algeriensis]|uniref:Uncharacterized protein n=1 Tax=Actinophytocola algeriensis TaxID=1768010 RepID=A0A7W7Q569_9PSEU|nr:hypothetical protein [Actinophytocola algeriensis]MBB4907028.1 hypothetical protein [Actinophytocola algeriensis]MBE1478511.1 hypothetical protein [Actinophytocola algeriensis]